MDHDRGLEPESAMERRMQLLVGPMIGPADHVRDCEVMIVDDAREVECGSTVVAPQHHAVEALVDTRGPRGLEVPVGPVALANGPFVPPDAEPAEVAEDRLLAADHVSSRIRVVDAKKQPVAEPSVRHCTERVADMQGPGGARREADARHAVGA